MKCASSIVACVIRTLVPYSCGRLTFPRKRQTLCSAQVSIPSPAPSLLPFFVFAALGTADKRHQEEETQADGEHNTHEYPSDGVAREQVFQEITDRPAAHRLPPSWPRCKLTASSPAARTARRACPRKSAPGGRCDYS